MDFIKRTIELGRENVETGGQPFACVIVKDGKILAESANQEVQTKNPIAHAEIVAIDIASKILQSKFFTGCDFYVMTHPCPMCLAALYLCSPDSCTFITQRTDWSSYYSDERKYSTHQNLYDEIAKPWEKRKLPMRHQPDPQAIEVFKLWNQLNAPKQKR